MTPVDWHVGALYIAAFFGLLLYLRNKWGWVLKFADVTDELHPSSKLSHTLIPKLAIIKPTTHSAVSPQPWLGFVEEVNREGSVQIQRCEQQRGDLARSVSLCHHRKEPRWVPLPSTSLFSPFRHPQWTLGISHHDLVSPIIKKTLWPAWKQSSTHKHAKNSTSIHHTDAWKENLKWQAVSSGLIVSNFSDLVQKCWHRNTLIFRFYLVEIMHNFVFHFIIFFFFT